MYDQFHTQKIHIPSTNCIHMFCMDFRIGGDLIPTDWFFGSREILLTVRQKIYLTVTEMRFCVFSCFQTNSEIISKFEIISACNSCVSPNLNNQNYSPFSKSTKLMQLKFKIVGHYLTSITIFTLLSVRWASVTFCRFSLLWGESVENCFFWKWCGFRLVFGGLEQ